MPPFQPSGSVARWVVIYELLTAAKVDDVVTYEQMGVALGLDARRDRHRIQMAVRKAAEHHEHEDKRAVEAVPNIGYRIVHAPEQIRLAGKYQKKSNRSLVRGHSKAVNVDLSEVDEGTRNAFDVVARAFALQMDYNRRLDVRQQRLEDAMESVEQRQQRSDEEIVELRARLERLERG